MTSVLEHRGAPVGRSLTWWAMGMFVLTEAVLFSLLLVSYFYLRSRSTPVWPPDGIRPPDLSWPAAMTLLLVASSVPVQWAVHARRRDALPEARAALLLGAAMGAGFLALQASEYVRTAEEFTPRTNAYGSLFFTITGFHGAHVTVGVLLLVFAALRTGADARRTDLIEAVAFYWHFVDVVWLAVFASLYLGVAW